MFLPSAVAEHQRMAKARLGGGQDKNVLWGSVPLQHWDFPKVFRDLSEVKKNETRGKLIIPLIISSAFWKQMGSRSSNSGGIPTSGIGFCFPEIPPDTLVM